MNKTSRYKIYNISAEKLLKRPRAYADEINNYRFPLYDSDSPILEEDNPVTMRNLNALFYQIIAANDLDESDEDCLMRQIVNVNFKSISNHRQFNKFEEKLRNIFDGKDGIKGIVLDFKNEQIRFVPFDKSGSMTRECRITFIREDIKDKVDSRLLLDFPFNKMKIEPSKYFAYRGLYLSDAKRIEDHQITDDGEERSMPLNEKTVVVVDDFEYKLRDYINSSAGIYTNTKTPDQNGCISFLSQKIEDAELAYGNSNYLLKGFDGEGLICPEYSRYINVFLKDNNYLCEDATSFQVRLPFIKGMLHEVDYYNITRARYNRAFINGAAITDYFGINRDFSKTKIILTKSMFKAAEWLNDLSKTDGFKKQYRDRFGEEEIDVMKFYFSKCAEYDHALYIRQTDTSLMRKRVFMNYQFISTLNVDKKAINRMLKRHEKYIQEIEKDYIGDDNDENNSFTEPDVWQVALKKNRDFVNDRYIKKNN